jgi:hypothetical protein
VITQVLRQLSFHKCVVDALEEAVSLAILLQKNEQFAKVDWEFKPQKADGSFDAGIHFKFDIKANKVG